MGRVLQTPPARRDITDIWLYLAERSPATADKTLDRLNDGLGLLATQPFMGRARPEIGTTVRSFVIGSFTAFYEPLDDGIELLRVIHAARDLNRAFDLGDE
ncbi:MAG: type II toxin-antitoxin system RelE/ParE family toxin [Bacteroidota bacterium]